MTIFLELSQASTLATTRQPRAKISTHSEWHHCRVHT